VPKPLMAALERHQIHRATDDVADARQGSVVSVGAQPTHRHIDIEVVVPRPRQEARRRTTAARRAAPRASSARCRRRCRCRAMRSRHDAASVSRSMRVNIAQKEAQGWETSAMFALDAPRLIGRGLPVNPT